MLDDKVTVRFEVLERANSHQLVSWVEMKSPPFHNRTFLNIYVCQKLSADVWVCAMVPLNGHARIGPHDERGCVRAEGTRVFRCSAAAESETLVEYVCSLDLKGHLPAWFTERVVTPQLMRLPDSIRRYAGRKESSFWRSIRVISGCGRHFGRLLDADLEDRSDQNKIECHKLYFTVLLGFIEDLPMSALSVISTRL
jgi:hypothetical protein